MKERVLNNFLKELEILLRKLPDNSTVVRGDIEGTNSFMSDSFLTFTVSKSDEIGLYKIHYRPYLFNEPDLERCSNEPFYKQCFCLLVPMEMKRILYFLIFTSKLHNYRFKKFGLQDNTVLQEAVFIIKNKILGEK